MIIWIGQGFIESRTQWKVGVEWGRGEERERRGRREERRDHVRGRGWREREEKRDKGKIQDMILQYRRDYGIEYRIEYKTRTRSILDTRCSV